MVAKGKMLTPCLKHLMLLALIFLQGHVSCLPGSPSFEKMVEAFGKDIIDSHGFIDQRILNSKLVASQVGFQ